MIELAENRKYLSRLNICLFIWLGISICCVGIISWSKLKYLSENFGNFDVAGIVYNAELILDGGLPYRDTFEVKTPFLFYLFALVFWIFGRSLIYIRLIWGLWLLLSCALLYSLCQRLIQFDVKGLKEKEKSGINRIQGCLSGGAAAMLLAIYGTMFDINYASWLVLPLTFSMYSYLRARQGSSSFWYLVCGISASIAFFIKNPGGFVVFVFVVLEFVRFLTNRKWRDFQNAVKIICIIAVGSLAAFIPLFAHYAWRGELLSLFQGLFPGWVLKGVLLAQSDSSSGYLIFRNAGRGIFQIYRLFPLPALLALISIIIMLVRRSFLGYFGVVSLVWFIVSFLSVAITGGRFYPHHTILYLPSLVLLAVHPRPFFEIFKVVKKTSEQWLKTVVTSLSLIIAFYGIFLACQNIIEDKRYLYDWPAPIGRPEAQRIIGEYIRENTGPKDTIIAWGWFAWPIYHWSGRRSPSPIYKEMGILTNINTNTEWTLSNPIHFVPSPIADQYLDDVVKKCPSFIIVSNWYPFISSARNEPLLEFKGLVDYIQRNYVLDRNMWGFRIFRHKEVKSY